MYVGLSVIWWPHWAHMAVDGADLWGLPFHGVESEGGRAAWTPWWVGGGRDLRSSGTCGADQALTDPGLFSPQNCLSQQQLLTAVRQLQQLLKAQEARFAEAMRSARSRLAALQSSMGRLAPAAPPGGSRPLWVPSSTAEAMEATQALPCLLPDVICALGYPGPP